MCIRDSCRSLSLELAQDGITVNAICPGFIETPMLERSIDNIVEKTGMSENDARKSLMVGNPQRRFIRADEVAAAAVWLCSDAARSVNGHALSISGGEVCPVLPFRTFDRFRGIPRINYGFGCGCYRLRAGLKLNCESGSDSNLKPPCRVLMSWPHLHATKTA